MNIYSSRSCKGNKFVRQELRQPGDFPPQRLRIPGCMLRLNDWIWRLESRSLQKMNSVLHAFDFARNDCQTFTGSWNLAHRGVLFEVRESQPPYLQIAEIARVLCRAEPWYEDWLRASFRIKKRHLNFPSEPAYVKVGWIVLRRNSECCKVSNGGSCLIQQ